MASGTRRCALLVAALLVLLFASSTSASLIAVDLGSEFLKVSLIKPGRTPISIVVNEMSKRKSPALVGFVNGERLLAEEAFSFAVRYPDSVFARVRDLLGRPAAHPLVGSLLADHGLPYTVVPHPNGTTAALQLKDGDVHTAEELVVRRAGLGAMTAKQMPLFACHVGVTQAHGTPAVVCHAWTCMQGM